MDAAFHLLGQNLVDQPLALDAPHAFASDGEVVRKSWPDFYTGTKDTEAKKA